MMSWTTLMKSMAGFFLVYLLLGCSGSHNGSTNNTIIDPYAIEPSSIQTFASVSDSAAVCTEDGKPVIRLFSTTECRHCIWISDTFDAVVEMYVDQGLIVAYHWEVDTGDDTLTVQDEDGVPVPEMDIFYEFNQRGLVPTYVFGCKYYRIGNGYESQNDLEAEAAEFMAVIEELLDEM